MARPSPLRGPTTTRLVPRIINEKFNADGSDKPQTWCTFHEKLGWHNSSECSLNPAATGEVATKLRYASEITERRNPYGDTESLPITLAVKGGAYKDDPKYALITCYGCGKQGHIKMHCPYVASSGNSGGKHASQPGTAKTDSAMGGLAKGHNHLDDNDYYPYKLYAGLALSHTRLTHEGHTNPKP